MLGVCLFAGLFLFFGGLFYRLRPCNYSFECFFFIRLIHLDWICGGLFWRTCHFAGEGHGSDTMLDGG